MTSGRLCCGRQEIITMDDSPLVGAKEREGD